MTLLNPVKTLLLSLILLCSSVHNNVFAQKTHANLDLAKPIENFEYEATTMGVMLAEIAYRFDVPIGLEIALADVVSSDKKIKVVSQSGTLKNVLDSLVGQRAVYRWEMRDGVINVFPKNERHGECSNEVLNVKVANFTIEKRESSFTFRDSLLNAVEVKTVLGRYRVKPYREVFPYGDLSPLGRDYAATMSGLTVRQILNQVILDSPTKYWVVDCSEKRGDSFLLNL